MSPRFAAPIGTNDVLPPEADRWRALTERFADHAWRCGFAMVATPMFEDLGVFARLGAGTDVVAKEMYDFVDKGGRHLALRPESTAGVARAFVQHRPALPWKVWYSSAHFRYEAPQKGRVRQHHQLGAEAFGAADPDLDAEVIVMLWDFLLDLGLRDIRLDVNFIGDAAARAAYATDLRSFLDGRRSELDPADEARVESNPFRVLDSKSTSTQRVVADAPTLDAYVDDVGRAHAERVLGRLAAAEVPATVRPSLVRGLDYYTHTVFEIVSEAIDAAQSTVGGGGRYNGLVEALDGPAVPGVGFGAGIERILLALDAEERGNSLAPAPAPDVFVVGFGGDGSDVADIALLLRRAGIGADRAYDGRSAKAQMKAANRSGARLAVLSGDDERSSRQATIRDLRDDRPQTTVDLAELATTVRSML